MQFSFQYNISILSLRHTAQACIVKVVGALFLSTVMKGFYWSLLVVELIEIASSEMTTLNGQHLIISAQVQ